MRVVIYLEQQQDRTDKSKHEPRTRDLERYPLRPIVVKRGTELVTFYL